MKSHVLRLYVVAITLLVFFVLWATVAARPWAAASSRRPAVDPRLAALDRWERRLKHESQSVNRTLDRRWHAYRVRLKQREARIRKLKQQYARRLAAVRAAEARLAVPATSYASAPAAGGSGTSRVVTLPPTVRVVTLPPTSAPVTRSGSSHP